MALHRQVLQLHLQRRVVHDRRQLPRQTRLVRVLLHLLPLPALQLRRAGDQVFHAAILLDQRRRRLLAEAGDARDVVHRVTHQRQDVHHLLRALDAPLRAHLRHAQDLHIRALPARLVNAHRVRHELAEVLVRRHHERLEALPLRALRQDADDVIRLVAVPRQQRDAHRRAQAVDLRDGARDVLRHLLPLRLVFRENLMPRRRRRRVQHHRQMRGLLVFQDVQKRVRKPVERRSVHPVARADRVLDEGEMRAVKQRHPVEEKKAFGHPRRA